MKSRRYYINGWRESAGYFFSCGRFTEEEKELLEQGQVVRKSDSIGGYNEFWISMDE